MHSLGLNRAYRYKSGYDLSSFLHSAEDIADISSCRRCAFGSQHHCVASASGFRDDSR